MISPAQRRSDCRIATGCNGPKRPLPFFLNIMCQQAEFRALPRQRKAYRVGGLRSHPVRIHLARMSPLLRRMITDLLAPEEDMQIVGFAHGTERVFGCREGRRGEHRSSLRTVARWVMPALARSSRAFR